MTASALPAVLIHKKQAHIATKETSRKQQQQQQPTRGGGSMESVIGNSWETTWFSVDFTPILFVAVTPPLNQNGTYNLNRISIHWMLLALLLRSVRVPFAAGGARSGVRVRRPLGPSRRSAQPTRGDTAATPATEPSPWISSTRLDVGGGRS
jgi:hypothetical protein